jgi:hypothetical protein
MSFPRIVSVLPSSAALAVALFLPALGCSSAPTGPVASSQDEALVQGSCPTGYVQECMQETPTVCIGRECVKLGNPVPPPAPTCGEIGQPCCGNSCRVSYNTCLNSTCVDCGNVGMPACEGTTCFSGAIASNGACVSCGGATVSAITATAGVGTITVTYATSSPFSTYVAIVNESDSTDVHYLIQPAGVLTAFWSGLRDGATYAAFVSPLGCTTTPEEVTATGTLEQNQTQNLVKTAGGFTFLPATATAPPEVVFTVNPVVGAFEPSLIANPPTVKLSSFTADLPDPFPAYTVDFTGFSLDESSIVVAFNATDIEIKATASLSIYAHNNYILTPNATISTSGATIDAHLAWNAATSLFTVVSVAADAPLQLSCGLICEFVPEINVDGQIAADIQTALAGLLAQQSTTATVLSVIAAVEDASASAATPWSIAPGTLTYGPDTAPGQGPGMFDFGLTRVNAPRATATTLSPPPLAGSNRP